MNYGWCTSRRVCATTQNTKSFAFILLLVFPLFHSLLSSMSTKSYYAIRGDRPPNAWPIDLRRRQRHPRMSYKYIALI